MILTIDLTTASEFRRHLRERHGCSAKDTDLPLGVLRREHEEEHTYWSTHPGQEPCDHDHDRF